MLELVANCNLQQLQNANWLAKPQSHYSDLSVVQIVIMLSLINTNT